ncbi:TPA: hypothetical protein VEP96_004790 [Pseudomonas aeruginosa]|nr:hypothetical protein [Pseudomonas aeruginosa]
MNIEDKTSVELFELAFSEFKKEFNVESFMNVMEYIFDNDFPDFNFCYDSFYVKYISGYSGKERGRIENFIAGCSDDLFKEYLANIDEERMAQHLEYWFSLDPYSSDLDVIKSINERIKKW